MIYQVAVVIAILASVSAKLFPENHTQQKYLWESFKREFSKSYETMEEEVQRFNHFLENLKIADLRNEAERRAGGSAVHGITKFTDLSQAEFQAQYLKADVTMKDNNAQVVTINTPPTANALVDWTGVLTTPVKDQGYCGSCWAFSATEQIESDAIRQLGVEYILSPEQIVQCDKTSFGCNGGWPSRGFSYVQRNGGIETEADYPYTSYYGTTGTCSSTSSKNVVTVSSYYTLTTEDSIASYVQSTGPVSICIDASNWSSYTGGILSVCGNDIDHAVQAVGVYPATTGGYWKVRNSWGTSWGESGFIRLAYGADTCGFTYAVTYTSVSNVKFLRG